MSAPSTRSHNASRVGGGDDEDSCGINCSNATTSSSSTTRAISIVTDPAAWSSTGDSSCCIRHTIRTDSVSAVRTEQVRWLAEPTLDRPVLIAGFTGWNDAGDAASTALTSMIESWDADVLAEIDPEPFTDFATVRPQVRLDEDRNRSIVWPTVGVWSASLPGTDVILLLGPEPALRWRLFSEQVTGIADRFEATMAISVGALLADVPHSRPVPLIGTASDNSLIERFDLQRSQYEGPTGIVGVLHDALHQAGLPTASLWAAVPGYAAQVPSPKAAMALVDRACSMIGTP
ncbi:MAG: hypothetical protein GKR86_13055, partial [Ilumatobacter sp.]|nr:hypothetical protein [Ilumatobacter sp.]